MSRRRQPEKRVVMPDPLYGSELLAKFINQLMVDGKKSIAEKIVYGALDIVKNEVKDKDVIEAIRESLDNIRPLVEVKSRRVGGATYQVPIEVSEKRGVTLAMKWLIKAARSRNEKTMAERLAKEIIESLSGRGSAVKKREDTHKMAEANKAFAHYRW